MLYSHNKEWEMPFAATWMDLEIIMLSEEYVLILLKLKAIKQQQQQS